MHNFGTVLVTQDVKQASFDFSETCNGSSEGAICCSEVVKLVSRLNEWPYIERYSNGG